MKVRALNLILPSLILALLLSPFSYASLGGDIGSVERDAQSFGVKNTFHNFKTYARYEISTQWLQTHEFMDNNGKVFALTWKGSKHPDLNSLLSGYFKQFQSAIAQARRQTHHGGASIVDQGNFHLEIGGQMRSVYGKVWLTDQIPAGVDVHAIR